MFTNFGLNKTQAWLPITALLLCCSICPSSSYPHAEKDKDPWELEGEEVNEENQDLASNEGEDLEGEDAMEDATPKPCSGPGGVCRDTADCCVIYIYTVKCRDSKLDPNVKKCFSSN